MSEKIAKDPLHALYQALAEFQKDLQVMEKSGEVKAGTYSFKYTPLDVIMKNIYQPLGKLGLSVRHELNENGIEAILAHKEGGEIRSGAIQIARTGKMQDIGGQITYARRYTITMLLGIASDEDTDAGQLTVPGEKSTARDAAQQLNVVDQLAELERCGTMQQLKQTWAGFAPQYRSNVELYNKKEEMKKMIEVEVDTIQIEEPLEDNAEPEN